MNIAIDISPLKRDHYLQHRVRGTGFYIEHLRKSLTQNFPDNKYTFFTKGEKLSNIDIVHCTYFEPFFLTLPFIKKNKTVVTVHDLTPLVFPANFPRGKKGEVKWQIQKFNLKKMDAIITDSISSKKDIERYAGIESAKINVVYLSAGEEFKPCKDESKKIAVRKKYNLPEKFILCVGDATWNKNLPRLIEAVKNMKLKLVMVGQAISQKNFDKSNPWNKDLLKVQNLIKENKEIIAIGFIPTEDLVTLYNTATVFAMPSLYEGFGLPVLEAMACGCPVVVSKEGSIPEIAGEEALYVDAYSTESIARGLSELFNKESLQRKYSQIGVTQAKKFSWKKTAEDTFSVYKKIVG